MRARFWLWMAVALFGAACGLDPQPTLPRGTTTDEGGPGVGVAPPENPGSAGGTPTPSDPSDSAASGGEGGDSATGSAGAGSSDGD